MTGPRMTTVHPHRPRARRLLPFLAAIALTLACAEQPTEPQVPGTAPLLAVTRSHPYLVNRTSQMTPAAMSVVRAPMSSASVSATTAATSVPAGPRVLILSDLNGPTTTALANSIAAAGFHVGVKQAPEYNWFGTNPAPGEFDVIIHLNGATYALPLSAGAQAALNTFVTNGGGFVGAQWNGSEESQGQQTGMPNLVLLGSNDVQGQNCADCDVTYNTVPGQESHPLLAGVPASFTFHADGHDASAKSVSDPATVVLMRVPSGGPALLARQYGAGKVVNFSFAPNYGLTGDSGMLMDPRIQQLYVNAVRWLSGSAGNQGSGSLDSDADGFVDATDTCVNQYNPDQLDTDRDGLGDACDPDADGDLVLNDDDNCELYNPDQADVNENWVGDACEEVKTQAQVITFDPLIDRTFGDPDFSISASASSGLPVTFTVIGNCALAGTTVSITGAGSCTIVAQQGGNEAWTFAADVARSFNVAKAPATITLGTAFTFDGTVKRSSVTVTPAGLSGVVVAYTLNGLPVSEPINAGIYQVVATLDNPNYQAPLANGTLTINPAVPVIDWTSPAAITSGTPLGATQLNATATGVGGVSVAGNFVYLPAAGTVLAAGVRPISVELIPSSGNYTRAIKTVTITVTAAEVPESGLKFKGFFRPIHNLPAVNLMKAGRAVPVMFSVEGARGLGVLQPNSPTSVQVSCNATASERAVQETVKSDASQLRAAGSTYVYIWKTRSEWEGTCRKLVVTLIDGSAHEALFRFTKHSKRKDQHDKHQGNRSHGSNDKHKGQEKPEQKKH